MDKVTYTKGRWYNNGGRIESVASTYQQPVTICCVGIVNQQMPQDTANARLIAAAPDLLDELQKVVEVIKHDDAPWWIGCPDKGGFDVESIEALIAKAEVKP